jgi:sec-independent protein translocase protein TatB
MGSLSFAEIVTILLVVLIVFGPDRLPEFAKKLGELMAQARRATSQFSKDISTEWGDAVEPIRAVKDDYEGVKKDLKDATAAITGFGSEETEEKTSDLRPQTSDAEVGDDPTSVPLSRGTGESASQGDEGAERDLSRGTGESASQGDGGAETTDNSQQTTDGAEAEETTDPGPRTPDQQAEAEGTSGQRGEGSQGADTEMGEA